MDDFEREVFRDKRRRAALRRLQCDDPICVICGEDDPLVLELDHNAGRKHHDTTSITCRNCHGKRTERQREQPKGGADPRNPLEVIGRWLLSIAEYFEGMVATLRRFGEFLIKLAREGYGSEFSIS